MGQGRKNTEAAIHAIMARIFLGLNHGIIHICTFLKVHPQIINSENHPQTHSEPE